MKKEHLALLAGGVVVGVVAYLVLANGALGGYAYTCADGTEFRLNPSADRSSVTIHPTKNAAIFPENTLEKVAGEVGTTFVGGTVVLFGKGTDLQLITTASSTVCKPAGGKEPLDWGA